MSKNLKRVAILGAGIVGLSSAVRCAEQFSSDDVQFTLISKDFSPNTTGDISAGFWKPYLCGAVDPVLMNRWMQESFDFFLELSRLPIAGDIGVCLLAAYELTKETHKEDFLGSGQTLGFRYMDKTEMTTLFPSAQDFEEGTSFTTLSAQCNKLLPYLLKRFQSKGGIVEKREINHLEELGNEFDVVINCLGLSALSVVPDSKVYPIRGQVIRIKAPWIKYAVSAGEYHVLANTDYVQLGGTKQKCDWNLEIDPNDTKNILEGCAKLVPNIKDAEILDIFVGLRPSREDGVRLERDAKSDIQIIHNYGHGGSGVTLAWGCAGSVVAHLKQIIN